MSDAVKIELPFENRDEEEKNKAVKKKRLTCKNYFVEFASATSLHGLQYVGERGRTVIERIWWISMFIFSLITCTYLIYKVYMKWDQSPVIVSFAESPTPVWEVPFPAITICSETKSRQTSFNFTEAFHNIEKLTDHEISLLETVSLVCNSFTLEKKMYNKSDFTNNEAINLLTSVAPDLNEMMVNCLIGTTLHNCSDLFTPILTQEGLCFTSNMLNAQELFRNEMLEHYEYLKDIKKSEGWSLGDGYPKNLPFKTYPTRGMGAGTTTGITVVFKAYSKDLDYLCRGPVQGFKVSLHTPVEMPQVSQQYFRVPLNQEVIAAVKPNMITTSEGLKSYNPKRRQCYFPNERKLRYYKVYTQNNCDLECLTNYTDFLCDCVTFSMPRKLNTPICSVGKLPCVYYYQDDLMQKISKIGFNNENLTDIDAYLVDYVKDCNCLPACTVIGYDVEVSQADYNWKKVYESYAENITEEIQLARMVLFLKQPQFITSRRSELYGTTDFLANCGGLLGLCLGFSFLSLIEIIYFLTLRQLLETIIFKC
ncbi:pickpocket protein 28-like [Arctopsyche grandis]|uniref:pickpocket protein 28-like n=1 Tax=Arctopsyche grandis TaxID=121162 RepID=UPI00406D9E06